MCRAGAHCPGQSDDEYYTEFALWVVAQSPLVLATDVRELTPLMSTLLLNSELIAMHQVAFSGHATQEAFRRLSLRPRTRARPRAST